MRAPHFNVRPVSLPEVPIEPAPQFPATVRRNENKILKTFSYTHVYYWPGETVAIGGMKTKVLSAKLKASGKPVKVEQTDTYVRFTGLPATAPEDPITVVEAQCEGEPLQDLEWVRKNRQRLGV